MNNLKSLSTFCLTLLLSLMAGSYAFAQQPKIDDKEASSRAAEPAARIPDNPLPDPPIVVGITENETSTLLKVYPNPNQGTFKVALQHLNGKEVRINNLLGQQVHRQYIEATEDEAELQLPHLKPGIYLLTVDRKTITFKIVS